MFSLSLVITGLVIGSFYALLAVGYTVIYGTIRLINFAHGDMYMLGAFVGFTVLGLFGSPGFGPWAILIAATGSLAATGLTGFLIRWVFATIRSKAGTLSPMITAVGVSLVVENSALHIWGSQPLAFPVQLPQDASKIGITLATCLALMIATEVWVEKTRFGAAMRAVGIDHGAVRLMGIRVERVLFTVFIVFSAIAGFTGLLAASYYGVISFLMGFGIGLKGFTAAILGGIGNVRGALVGGWVLGLTESFGGGLLGTEWTDVIAFSVLIAVLVLRPNGLLGETVVERT